MARMPWLVVCAGMFVWQGCRHHESRADYVADKLQAWPVSWIALRVAGHGSIDLETRELSRSAAPVLQLWDVAAQAEVAQASGWRWLMPRARLRYRNPDPEARDYRLLVRARDIDGRGQADIYRDGRLLLRHAAVGGTPLRLSHERGIVYRVASTPGGPRAATLFELDAKGQLLAFDEHSGSTGLPSLPSSARVSMLLLAANGDVPGRFHVYANDVEDRDGDGLGRKLEHALGTCDSADDRGCLHSPLSAYYRQVTGGTRDTDRDGLSDADEVLGGRAPELDLPRFGVDPRHKDVLVEVDHHASLDSVGFSEAEFAQIAALFAQGGARDLKNPDGLPGVRVHFDAGFEAHDRANLSLLGDWGGSGVSQAREYRAARKLDFTKSRVGYFRYAFSTRQGRGQTTGDAFTVNRDLQRVTIFAHELGHTLGLAHYGHPDWGKANCKPNYYSIMNYLYQNRYEIGFSRGVSRSLNPASVFERAALTARDPAYALREPPLELDVMGRDVDWNRDGVISDVAVKADLLWATYKSCGAAEHDLVALAANGVAPATPVLLQIADHRYALWLSESGELSIRRRRLTGICPSHDAADGCSDWSPVVTVLGLSELRQIAGMELSRERLALAYVHASGALHIATLAMGSSEPQLLTDVEVAAARTEHAVSLTFLNVAEQYYGAKRVLSVMFRATGQDGALWSADALDASGPFVLRRQLGADLQPLRSRLGPSRSTLPHGELCGVFADADGFMRFYCYLPARDVWADLSQRTFEAGLGPHTSGSPGLAFHRYRDATNALIDNGPERGALYMSFTEPESSLARYPDNPHFFVSQWLSAAHPATEQISMRWRGRVINEWTQLAPGTSVALYEGATNLEGLMAVQDLRTHSTRLDYLPYADGSFDGTLSAGNDFQVMERALCVGLQSEARCGDSSTGAY